MRPIICLFLLLPVFASAQVPTITGNAQVQVFQGNDVWRTSLNTLLAGRVGPDSSWVKLSGSYLNKRISDNLYRYGTLGLRTTDTTGVLTIQQDETGSKPSIYLAGNQETLLRLQADSNGDSLSHWGIYRQFFDNASSVGDNQVVSIGFNTFSGGGQDNPARATMRIGMEEKFTYGTRPAFELHIPEVRTKSGATRRPLTGLFGHDLAGGGAWTFQADHIVFQDYKTAGNDVTWGFATNGAYPKGLVFSDTGSISFGKALSGSAINFRNAANSAYVKALTLNTSNFVEIGTTAAGLNLVPASIRLNSSPKLYTTDGSGISVGYSTYPSDMEVYAATQAAFRLRNSLETTGWYLRVGASAFDLYTPTNTAALVVSETAPNYTLSLKSDGDVGLGILTPLSRTHIYTSSGATKSMIRLENSAHAADVFTTNATPEGAITAPAGSIALSNISSAGGLWTKVSGSGNTGWDQVAVGIAPNSAKSYYLTRTLPASGSTIHLGVLNHSGGGGGYCELHCVVNNGSGNAIAKKYLIPLAFSNTGGVWQNLLPIASTGAYIGNDFKIEMKNSSTRDTLRVRTVSGSTGGTLLVSLYMYPYQGSTSTFVETTTAETPTAVTATFSKMPWSAEGNKAGINTLNPARTLDVTGEVRISDLTTDTPTLIVGADSDGDLGAITVGAGLSLSSGTLTATGGGGVTDHGALTGLSDDDHTQYLLLAGRSGGQVATGGTGSGDDMTIRSTTNATKGDVIMQDQGGNVILGGGELPAELRFQEGAGGGSNYTAFKAPTALSTDITYTLPNAAPTSSGQVLAGTTGGTLSWVDNTQAPSVIRPSQLTAKTDNWNPSGYSTTREQTIELSGDGSFRCITGLESATRDGVRKTLHNSGATNCVLVAKEHTDSDADNRFGIPADVVLYPGMQATFRYDSVSAVWRLLNTSAADVQFSSRTKLSLFGNGGGSTSDGYTFTTSGGTNTVSAASSTAPTREFFQLTSVATAFPTTHSKNTIVYLSQDVSYIRVAARVKTPQNVSDATNSYELRVGFEVDTDTIQEKGAYLAYNHSENSGGWVLKTSDGSSITPTNAGSPISATTWYDLEVVYYPYGEVAAWVDGVRYTSTATLPNNGAMYSFIQLDRDQGTSTRTLIYRKLETESARVAE